MLRTKVSRHGASEEVRSKNDAVAHQ